MSWFPHITTAAMVEHENKLLFVKEVCQGKLVLNQPAGHVEKGETLAQAAVRETLEEAGCDISVTSLLGIYSHYYEKAGTMYYRACFIARLDKIHENLPLDDDIIEALWLKPEQARQQSCPFRSPLVEVCMNDYLAGKSYPLSVINELSI